MAGIKHLSDLRSLIEQGFTAVRTQADNLGVSEGYVRHLRHLLRRDDEREAAAKADEDILQAAQDWENFIETCPEDEEHAEPPPFSFTRDWGGPT